MQNLYRHFDKDCNLLYVGASLNVVSRLIGHKQQSHWFEQIVRIEIEKFSTRKDSFIAERKAIKDEKPLHNISRPMTDAEIEIESNHSFDDSSGHKVISHKLFGEDITQHIGTRFLSATDLIRAGNRARAANMLPSFDMSNWFKQKTNQSFLSSLEDKFGIVKISGRGRGNHTWVHPFIFMDMARAFGSKLKIEFHIWLEIVISEIKS